MVKLKFLLSLNGCSMNLLINDPSSSTIPVDEIVRAITYLFNF